MGLNVGPGPVGKLVGCAVGLDVMGGLVGSWLCSGLRCRGWISWLCSGL